MAIPIATARVHGACHRGLRRDPSRYVYSIQAEAGNGVDDAVSCRKHPEGGPDLAKILSIVSLPPDPIGAPRFLEVLKGAR